ncbi:MAG: iron uptake transporter permease EfeU [Candidatus Nanopelagicaceae bacterium]
MLNTFVIALREGLEASLIVGILLAYIVKTGRVNLRSSIWKGVGLAVFLSLAFGALLSFTSATLSEENEELFAGVTGLAAVALVTWMVFWMRKTSKNLRRELEEKVSKAISGTALVLAAFVAVIREGLETSLFLYATFRSGTDAVLGTIGLVLGLALAVALGYGIYRGAIRFNLSKFFTISGIALIFIAASVLQYSLHELSEVGLFPESGVNLTSLVYVLVTLAPFIREIPALFEKAKPRDEAKVG